MATISILSEAHASVGGFEPEKWRDKRWFDILKELKAHARRNDQIENGHLLHKGLQEALESMQQNSSSSNLGMKRLLIKASEMAKRGSFKSAWKAAMDVLDSYLMVQKYRQSAPCTCSENLVNEENNTEGKTVWSQGSPAFTPDTNSMSDEGEDRSIWNEPCLKRLKTDSPTASIGPHAARTPSPSTPSMARWDSSPHHTSVSTREKRSAFRSPLRKISSANAATVSTSNGSCTEKITFEHPAKLASKRVNNMPMTTWEGSVILQSAGSSVSIPICSHITMDIPTDISTYFSKPLVVHKIVPRKIVKLGVHVACRVHMDNISAEERSILEKVATTELVGLVPIGPTFLILIPYFDNSHALRMVGFVLL